MFTVIFSLETAIDYGHVLDKRPKQHRITKHRKLKTLMNICESFVLMQARCKKIGETHQKQMTKNLN